ncbi:MAG: hypothetical protein MI673_06625 [Thiotrichales bacterium]|nr:hypothetical protein [Thiotrichales bacterium]
MCLRHAHYFLALILACLGNSQVRADEVFALYDIVFTQNQSVMTVKACFGDGIPEQLVNRQPGATGLLKKAYVVIDDRPRSLVIRNGRILSNQLHGQDCLHYQVDFLRVMQMNRDLRYTPESMNHVRTVAGYWLWLPEAYDVLDISFHLDDNYQVSAPWQLVREDKGVTRYRIRFNNDTRYSLVYFGTFRIHSRAQAQSRLRVSILSNVGAEDEQKLLDWIHEGASALSLAYGEFPVRQLSVLVFPLGAYSSVVPWGEVKREGGLSVHLFVDETRPLAEMVRDWTLIHELCHTLHPYLSMQDRWLTEGLATYYQNVLQARSKTIRIKRAWTNLHQGFQRGIAQTDPGQSLRSVSENVRDNRKYMRVYWSGTALWLKADWLLRTRHGKTLDAVMQSFQHCCLQADRSWTAIEYTRRLDDISATSLFSTLYTEYANSVNFPDLVDVYNAIGLSGRHKDIELNPHAPNADLIQVIMTAK